VDFDPVNQRLDRVETWQRQTLQSIVGVQANQGTIWSNGVLRLHKKADVLIRAQVKAGNIKVAKEQEKVPPKEE
jgi:hypothetical protein